MAQLPNLSRELSSTGVIARFCLRVGILVVFAAFASAGFARGLATLLWMSIVLCAVIGAIRREEPFGAALNHWDETAAYAALLALVRSFDHFVPA
ncbi:MAG: hypothetical protein WB420_17100 [Bradyrhizobium sp.]